MSPRSSRTGVTIALTVICTAVLFVFASCSSSDSTNTTAASDSSTNTARDTMTGSDDAVADEFCDAFIAYFLSGQDSPGAIGPGAEDDPAYLEDSKAFFASTADHLATAARGAPPEIADDIAVMADAWGDANNRIAEATTASDVPQGFLESTEFLEAADNVGNYAREHCDMGAATSGLDG